MGFPWTERKHHPSFIGTVGVVCYYYALNLFLLLVSYLVMLSKMFFFLDYKACIFSDGSYS